MFEYKSAKGRRLGVVLSAVTGYRIEDDGSVIAMIIGGDDYAHFIPVEYAEAFLAALRQEVGRG